MIKDKNSLVREILEDYKALAERDDATERNPENSFIFRYYFKWFQKQTDAELKDEVQVHEFIKMIKSLANKLDNGKKAIDFKEDFKPDKDSSYKKKNKFVTLDLLCRLHKDAMITDEEYVKIFFGIMRTEARRHKTKETIHEWIVRETGISLYPEIARYIENNEMLMDMLKKAVYVKIESFFRANEIEKVEIENSDEDINEIKTTKVKKDKDYTYIDDVGMYYEFCQYRKIAIEEVSLTDPKNSCYIEDWDRWDAMYRSLRKRPNAYEDMMLPIGMNQELGISIYIIGRNRIENMLNAYSADNMSKNCYICLMMFTDSYDSDGNELNIGDLEFKYSGKGFLSCEEGEDSLLFRLEIFDSIDKAKNRYYALENNADTENGLLSSYRYNNYGKMPDVVRGTRYENFFEGEKYRPYNSDEERIDYNFYKAEKDFVNKADKKLAGKADKRSIV